MLAQRTGPSATHSADRSSMNPPIAATACRRIHAERVLVVQKQAAHVEVRGADVGERVVDHHRLRVHHPARVVSAGGRPRRPARARGFDAPHPRRGGSRPKGPRPRFARRAGPRAPARAGERRRGRSTASRARRARGPRRSRSRRGRTPCRVRSSGPLGTSCTIASPRAIVVAGPVRGAWRWGSAAVDPVGLEHGHRVVGDGTARHRGDVAPARRPARCGFCRGPMYSFARFIPPAKTCSRRPP